MRETVALLAALAATAVIAAAPAHADPEAEYLDTLAGQGFDLTAVNTRRLINFGKAACADIGTGGEERAVRHLASFPGADPARVRAVVSTAHEKLCPGA
ncbi:DUF732 domain-containing protein [Mycobacterium heckeshornense]|uniref:Uncharacterized protein n=1 Tax=Mycobacterium heckeshornense TaxID=110505 RepID=A0A2G8BGG5_9MYCO|nr:DUF732 domain-containing protein [Mycobacterium heckeshornense]KMV23373.1 hypothetical protein ACT16_06855 [Mycobacterium heckeshornense]MCV7032784.1 DUF732 domain-containing protein [Mycobacterium heckeshornense]PIJ36828.1 DUF732 domain-containing protein [Mycobacterium heckeshornense]BCO35424.1 hypothetical protein MHEC_18570 [Mycobacterium heckeshornense]